MALLGQRRRDRHAARVAARRLAAKKTSVAAEELEEVNVVKTIDASTELPPVVEISDEQSIDESKEVESNKVEGLECIPKEEETPVEEEVKPKAKKKSTKKKAPKED